MTLLFRNWGPLVQYRAGTLHVSDLNPEIKTQWQMSRWEMLGFGLRCVRAALTLSPAMSKGIDNAEDRQS